MARHHSFVLACLLIAAFALPALGDIIQVQLETGDLLLQDQSGRLVASGPDLEILAGADSIDANGGYPLNAFPARPGDVVAFNGFWESTCCFVIFQGTSYSTGGSRDLNNVFDVNTPTIVLPPLGDPFSVVLPFTLTYDLQSTLHAVGTGLVTIQFEKHLIPFGTPFSWDPISADYRIGAVPEPATLLLVASGFLFTGAASRALRHRRARVEQQVALAATHTRPQGSVFTARPPTSA